MVTNNLLHKIFQNLKIKPKLKFIKLSKYTYHCLIITSLANDNINPKLTNEILQLKIFKNLERLIIYKGCKVDQNGIQNLDLIELYANYNEKIKDVSFMKNLKNITCIPVLWNRSKWDSKFGFN